MDKKPLQGLNRFFKSIYYMDADELAIAMLGILMIGGLLAVMIGFLVSGIIEAKEKQDKTIKKENIEWVSLK